MNKYFEKNLDARDIYTLMSTSKRHHTQPVSIQMRDIWTEGTHGLMAFNRTRGGNL